MHKLSIIICKHNVPKYNKCIKNIKGTVQGEYELITIDNTNNTYNIFNAYNEGILKSTGDYLCFMHEDIMFYDSGWDNKVIGHFEKDSELGMLGIAGGASYSLFPFSWANTYHSNDSAISIIGELNGTKDYHLRKGFDDESKQVLIVDGLWFCIKASILKKYDIKFDHLTFNGFHRYDYDISFQMAKVAKIKVIQNIRIEHISSGNRTKAWMDANLKFHNKWKHILPCKIQNNQVGIFTMRKTVRDLMSLYKFVFMMKEFEFNDSEIRKVIFDNYFFIPKAINVQLKLAVIYLFGFKGYIRIKNRLKKQ